MSSEAVPTISAASSQPVVQLAPPVPATAAGTTLTGFGGFDPTPPVSPVPPPTPNPLAEALWAAYRETESSPSSSPSTGSLSATTQTNQPTQADPTVVTTIPVDPYQIALSPDGTRLYGTSSPLTSSSSQSAGTLQVVNTTTNTQVGDPIPVGLYAESVAVSPTTNRAYVTALQTVPFTINGQQVPGGSDGLVVIDTSTNKVIGSPILIGASQNGSQITETGVAGFSPYGSNVVVSPDGNHVYVSETTYTVDTANISTGTLQPTIYVFDTTTNTQVGSPIPIAPPAGINTGGAVSYSLAGPILISPSGDRLYASTISISNANGQPTYTYVIHPIDPTTGAPVGTPIVLDSSAASLAVPSTVVLSPDGKKLYVQTVQVSTTPTTPSSNQPQSAQQYATGTVLTYDTTTGQQIGTPIDVTGYGPIAVSPDGKTLYVTDVADSRTGKTGTIPGSSQPISYGSVTAYDASTGAQIGNPVTVGLYPSSLAVNSAGTRLYVANLGDDTISVVDITPANNDNPLQLLANAVIGVNEFIALANTNFGHLLGNLAASASTSLSNAVNQTTVFANQFAQNVQAEQDAIQSFIDTVGTLADHVVPGLGAGPHLANILIDLQRGNGGQAAFDTAQFLSGLAESSNTPVVKLFGVFLDIGSQAAQGLPAAVATPISIVSNYVASHPIGAVGAGTSAAVGAIGNAAFHAVGVPQVAIDAVVKPAQQGIQDGADSLDKLGHDAVDGASHVVQGFASSASNFFSGFHFP